MTDRVLWLAGLVVGWNVRRLMYQPLIWLVVLSNDQRRLRAAFDAEGRDRLADALVDRVRGNPQLAGDLFRIQMLVDEPQAVELPRRQPSYPACYFALVRGSLGSAGGVRHARRLLQC